MLNFNSTYIFKHLGC